jgi:autoinducer 2-degrading protein
MIRRVVKMHFEEEHVEAFLEIFQEVKAAIEEVEGCYSVELLRDVNDPTVMFTYSIWQDENSLNAYRKGTLFGKTWPRTKALFRSPPEAWSLEYI